MNRTSLMSVVAVGLLVGCAPAFDHGAGGAYDGAALGAEPGLYGAWDVDADGVIDDDEFYAGAFDTWDVDDDGLLSEEEFGIGVDEWDADVGAFDDWDTDASGLIDEDEFFTGVGV